MGLSQFKKPKVQIFYNDVDKTHLLGFTHISIDDFESDEADKLNINLHWQNAKPKEKDKIKIYIDDHFMGEFVISTIKYHYKRSYEIEAISANFFDGFKLKKNRTFFNQSYYQILKSIADENGYKIKADFERQDETLNLEQYDMSDCAFCKR